MFRDDRAALAEQNEQLRRELDQSRAENDAMRSALQHNRYEAAQSMRDLPIYGMASPPLTEGDRVAFGRHELEAFPVWAAVLLHVVTFGLWSLLHFGRMHGQLPRIKADDPSANRAVGFFFIPYFNIVWMFFSALRLNDRINLQHILRGRPAPLGKGPVIAGGVLTFFFYLIPVAWVVAVWKTQQAVNDLVAMGPVIPQAMQASPQAFTGVRVDASAPVAAAEPTFAEALRGDDSATRRAW